VSDNEQLSKIQEIDGYEILGTAHCMAANRLSYYYDLKGPSMTMDTACSSSLLALDRASKDIKAGIIERAIVCGISLCLDHGKNAILVKAQMLSPTGHCHVFDTRADGYCRADGIGCVILERGASGYALVVGSGTNQDGATAGITYPNSDQQLALMSEVLAESGVKPQDVDYHEAHGTGTTAGDNEELAALSRLYTHPLVVGSVKSNMGHSEGASGLMGLAKILLMFEDHQLYPNFDFVESPHEIIQSGRFSVLKESKQWEPGLSTISNFGFGGSNAFAILKPCPKRKTIPELPEFLNGTPFLSSPGEPPLPDYADFYAVQRVLGNSQSFRYDWKDDEWRAGDSPLVFVCNGQGSQWNKMGQDLMRDSKVFRSTIEHLDKETGIPLVRLYEDGDTWMRKENSAVGIVSFQLGLIKLLAEHGVQPDFFLGHSLGELACAYLAGVQTEVEVILAAKVRSDLVQTIDKNFRLDVHAVIPADGYNFQVELEPEEKQYVKIVHVDTLPHDDVLYSFSLMGKMVAVGCEAAVVEMAINEIGLKQTCVACLNAPKGQTISGPVDEVDKLINLLKEKKPGLFIRHVDTDNIAFHAPYLKVFREHLRKQFWEIEKKPLPLSWKSTSRNSTFSVDYLIDNICKPVYFQEAIESLPPGATVVEIGPACGLLSQIKRTRPSLQLIRFVERESATNLEKQLGLLNPWKRKEESIPLKNPTGKTVLHYSERYPGLWGHHTQFPLPTWANFERFQKKITTVKEISYDLTQAPWSSIRDHTLRRQNLFPAAGFLHVLWSANSFKKGTEIKDFRVVAPFVIPKSMTHVKFLLHQTGQYCEVWDSANETCHASGHVKSAETYGTRMDATVDFSSPEHQQFLRNATEGKYWYCTGDNFGPRYMLLDRITADFSTLKPEVSDFIAYIDR